MMMNYAHTSPTMQKVGTAIRSFTVQNFLLTFVMTASVAQGTVMMSTCATCQERLVSQRTMKI